MCLARVLLIPALALSMSGCVVVSLHALYSEADLVFDTALLGKWGDEDGTLTFTKSGDKSYLVLSESKKEPNREFEARMVRLGSYSFLDTYPIMAEDRDSYQWHLVQAHMFFRVRLEGDVLTLGQLDIDWLRPRLENNKLLISHEILSDEIVLTAGTKELQKFILALAAEKDAFTDSDPPLRRVK
jgi:hypothetical protein